ncbi:TetR/AcrR family transcriptional regulator [Roseivirga echinicomitans]
MEPIAEKKKLILESAFDIIKDQGFHGCPMSLVAKNAGVAAGTIYTYFESKNDLIFELYFHAKNIIYKHVSQKDDPSLDFKTRFFNYWNNLSQLYLDRPEIQRFFEQFMISPYNTLEVQNEDSPWYNWNGNFFKEGIDKGYLKNLSPEILFIMVIGSVNSMSKMRQNFNTKITEKGIDLNQLAEMTWDAIRKQK